MKDENFAEFETDRIIRENYFPDYKGVMVEVGGGTPVYLSISRHFILNGWRALIVEPNPKFAEQHREIGNEVYEYACSDVDKDDVEFQIVKWQGDDLSFSSLGISKDYMKHHGMTDIKFTPINVKVRKLDTILKEANVDKVDFLSVDTEGWELEVMRGLTINPRVVLLENYLHDHNYDIFMRARGYKLDKKVEYNYIYIL